MTASVPLSIAACWMIRWYQQRVSPYKGFGCAYRVVRGRDSCSQFASRAIARHGLTTGVRLTRRRFERCRSASHVLEFDAQRRKRDRRERFLWWMNGADPGCDKADAACCAVDVALEGCCELPGACH